MPQSYISNPHRKRLQMEKYLFGKGEEPNFKIKRPEKLIQGGEAKTKPSQPKEKIIQKKVAKGPKKVWKSKSSQSLTKLPINWLPY
jgi:hypothetical protein